MLEPTLAALGAPTLRKQLGTCLRPRAANADHGTQHTDGYAVAWSESAPWEPDQNLEAVAPLFAVGRASRSRDDVRRLAFATVSATHLWYQAQRRDGTRRSRGHRRWLEGERPLTVRVDCCSHGHLVTIRNPSLEMVLDWVRSQQASRGRRAESKRPREVPCGLPIRP